MVTMSNKPRRRDDLVQGTPAWHAWRNGRINASDAPIIMWEDPFKDPYRLWLEKTGRVVPPEFHDYWEGGELIEHPTHRGHRLEDVARNWYCRERGLFTAPTCLEHPSIEWMGCSLDGWPEPGLILEIKCPSNIRTHLDAREGVVTQSHYVQAQHAMYVAGVENCDLMSYFATGGHDAPSVCVNQIVLDREFVEGELLPAEREFRKWLEEDTFPLPRGEQEINPNDQDWTAAVTRYLEARRTMELAEREELAALRNLKLRTRGAARTRDGMIECKWFVRKGFISWTSIPGVQELASALGPRLDDYRRPASLVFRVNRLSAETLGGPNGNEQSLSGDTDHSG